MYSKPVLKLKPAALLVACHKQIAAVNEFMESSQLMSQYKDLYYSETGTEIADGAALNQETMNGCTCKIL